MIISRVIPEDIPRITALQNRLLLPAADTSKGFLVSAFSQEDYIHFAETYEFFYKAVENDEVLGVVMAYHSSHIVPEDKNNSLLRYSVKGDFILIKQIFISPDAVGGGVSDALYRHLFQEAGDALPYVCVIVMEPFNARSCRFHMRRGFLEFLDFTPDADRDGAVRKRSAWIRLPAAGGKLCDFVRFTNVASEEEDAGEVMSERVGTFVSLYQHEDNLNWTKFGLQTTVLFALFATFAYFYERTRSQDIVPILVILGIWGVVVNFLFLLKLQSGLKYMHAYKRKIKEHDRMLCFYYPKLTPVFKDNEYIAHRSITSYLLLVISLIGLLSWTVVAFLLLLKGMQIYVCF